MAQHTENTKERGSFRLQQGRKEEKTRSGIAGEGETDTADLDAALLARGRRRNEVFNKDTCSNKIPSERKQHLEITEGCVCFCDSVTGANLFITAMY